MSMSYSDEKIIEGIRNGGPEEDLCLEYLYRQNLTGIVRLIKQNNGSEEEGKDVFQDALISFYEQVKSGKYEPTIKISAYLKILAKRRWINMLKKKEREVIFRDLHKDEHTVILPDVLEGGQQAFVKDLMNKLGERSGGCKDILVYAIFQQLSMQEIAKKMGFKDEQSARNKKYKCLKYLKEIIRNSPLFRRTLDEWK